MVAPIKGRVQGICARPTMGQTYTEPGTPHIVPSATNRWQEDEVSSKPGTAHLPIPVRRNAAESRSNRRREPALPREAKERPFDKPQGIKVGLVLRVRVPSPSWPATLSPQQYINPATVIPQE